MDARRREPAPPPRPATPDAAPGTTAISDESFRLMDRLAGAAAARMTNGLSPISLGLAWMDWIAHLAMAPGKRAELAAKAFRKQGWLALDTVQSATDPDLPCCIEPLPGDDRFRDKAWRRWPFRTYAQGFLLGQQWWHGATHDVPGMSRHHEDIISFVARQMLDMASPANLPWANPEVLRHTAETAGNNLAEGAWNWLEDAERLLTGMPPAGAEAFRPGETVAVTPGRVIYRNRLIELVQYAPATETVFAEPILIVPAWIMKYYILDLSPGNSLIRHLVALGHTVFCISWRNVTEEDRDLSFDDYRRMGVMAALDAVGSVVPGRKVHAVGYCLGGTLLTVAAAAMADTGDDRLASLSLLAAQADFTEAGELQFFIDDSQIDWLENLMWERGTLDAAQMAGAFQMLRSRDLVWSRMVRQYLMGERPPMTDLMAWNADATRMPYRMQAEYLRNFFLNNDFASGRYMVEGHRVEIQNIRAPLFCVGTDRDHVTPWRSVYKIHYLSDAEITFVLATGGHNAGIVSEPGHPGRSFRMAVKQPDDLCLDPDTWMARAGVLHDGSWWLPWTRWLSSRSTGDRVRPPAMGAPAMGCKPLEAAPGTYVFQR